MKLNALVAVAAVVCLCCQAAQAKPKITRQVPVTDAFVPLDLRWSSDQVTYKGLWKVLVSADGFIEICGAGRYLDASRSTETRQWLYAIYVTLNGKKILKDMTFFSDVKGRGDLRKADAACRSTGVRAPDGDFSVSLGWPAG
jgi:hypothetical protein